MDPELLKARQHLSELLSENVANYYMQDLKNQYEYFDKDKNGTLDKEELIPVLIRFSTLLEELPIGLSGPEEKFIHNKFKQPTKQTVDEIFAKFDTNKDNLLSLTEFQTFGMYYLARIIEDMSHMI